MITIAEKLACVISTFCHAGIKVVKADEVAEAMFHDLDNSCDNAYFIARIDRYIHALQNARLLFETKTMEDSSNSEVEPSVQYVIKSTYPDGIVEFFAYYDDVNQEAFWVEDAQPAKKFDSKEKAKEFIIQLWEYIPNWFSFEEYSN